MKTIPLTQGQIALVDDEDFEELNQYSWCAIKARRSFYATRTKYYRGKRTIYMHHQIIGKPPKGFYVDHLDDNGLNNQKSNLNFVYPLPCYSTIEETEKAIRKATQRGKEK